MELRTAVLHYNLISNILFNSDNGLLSTDLKVKLMTYRIKLNKIVSEFKKDIQEFSESIIPEDIKLLSNMPNKSSELLARLKEYKKLYSEELKSYIKHRELDVITIAPIFITEDEFLLIVNTNINITPTINGSVVQVSDFLECLYNIFVK